MRFLDLLPFARIQLAKDSSFSDDSRFTDLPLRLFPTPSIGCIVMQQGSTPLVKFAGIFWRFRTYRSQPNRFVDGQRVKILGRQGNCLLIELEREA